MIARKRKTQLHRNPISQFLLPVSAILLWFIVSCSSTKYVQPNQHLLTKMSVKCDNRNINKRELESYIKQKPNRKILGFRFYLGIYNLVNPEKERVREERRKIKEAKINERRMSRGKKSKEKIFFTRWLRTIGEAPVIYDAYLSERSTNQLHTYLRNKGYYYAQISDTVIFSKKKAKVSYSITTNKPYRVDTIIYTISHPYIDSLIRANLPGTALKAKMLFDVDVLQGERSRITRLARDHGFYNFSREIVHFNVDSLGGDYTVKIWVELKPQQKRITDTDSLGISGAPLQRYRINKVFVNTHYLPQKMLQGDTTYLQQLDTLEYNGITMIFHRGDTIKADLLTQNIFINSTNWYSQADVEKTYKRLTSLRLIKLANITFTEVLSYSEAETGLLNCYIQLTPAILQSYTTTVEGTNSSGNLGIAGNLNYRHNSLFHGAEVFDVKLKGAVEEQRYLSSTNETQFSTVEYGAETRLTIPQFLFPFKSENFEKRFNPKTTTSLVYNYQHRPDYTRSIANAAFGYYWQSSEYVTYLVNPFEFNTVRVLDIDPAFQSEIDTLFIKYSYEDRVIWASNLSYIYNSQDINKKSDFTYFRSNIEIAGNALTATYDLLGIAKKSGSYNLFGTPYAQYFKLDFDWRYYQSVSKREIIAYRIFAGVAYPYGNLKALPFGKMYFAGGANSIRGWTVRSLGPGSYSDTKHKYPNQLADLKLEMNIEYRFKIFSVFEGALFVDAGNIWSIRDDERQGAKFQWNSFYNEIAVGTGIGARLDFSFFILRFDFGLKLRDPALTGKHWIPQTRSFSNDDWTFNVGIGYPF